MSAATVGRRRLRSGEIAVWTAALALAVLHQDLWAWSDRTLVFGVVPIGLFYHAVFSVACAVLWACAVRFAWPDHIEAWAGREGGAGVSGESGSGGGGDDGGRDTRVAGP